MLGIYTRFNVSETKACYTSYSLWAHADSSTAEHYGFCGGSLFLTDVSPNITFSTPFYQKPYTTNVLTDCYMYLVAPFGRQVTLRVLGLETMYENVYLYDHPSSTSSSYRIAQLTSSHVGQEFISTRGGLAILYDDYSTGYNGKGLLAIAWIPGIVYLLS